MNAKHAHQPDFTKLRISVRPENDNPDQPVVLTAPCVCGSAGEWLANVPSATWRADTIEVQFIANPRPRVNRRYS